MSYSHWFQKVSIPLNVSSPNSSHVFYWSNNVGLRRRINWYCPSFQNLVFNILFFCWLFMLLGLLFWIGKFFHWVHYFIQWKRRKINWSRWELFDPGGYWWPPTYFSWNPTIVSFSFPISLIVAKFTIFGSFRLLNFRSCFEVVNDIFSASNGLKNMILFRTQYLLFMDLVLKQIFLTMYHARQMEVVC